MKDEINFFLEQTPIKLVHTWCFVDDFVNIYINESTLIHSEPMKVNHLSKTYQLNRVGSIIWKMIDGKKSNKDILNYLYDLFLSVPEQTLIKDFQVCIEKLSINNLIEKNWERW